MELRRNWSHYVTFLATLALVGSAFRNSLAQSPTPARQAIGSKSGAPANTKEPSDESLTSEEYLGLGMAAHDRDWSADDMAEAAKILASLAEKGYRQLPRYQSKRSGDVFARLTSPQNLDILKDRTLPLNARLQPALNYFQANNEVLKLYLAGFVKNEVRATELVELMGSELRSTAVVVELVDELVPTIKKDDPSYDVRMQGLEKMKRGLASIVTGALQSLTERESYQKSELARLVGYMQETFPQIVPRLPPGARKETLLRLEKMQKDPALKDLQPGLADLLSKVKTSVEEGTDP